MKINVASRNENKVGAVREVIRDYKFLSGAEVISYAVESGVSKQPVSLKETIRGAMNRALKSFGKCDYSIGIEDGLMAVPWTRTGYMNVSVCAIYDGKSYSLGLGPSFEYPINVTKSVIEDDLDINQASFKHGLTEKQDVGNDEGTIGILTKGRLKRKEGTKQAVIMALIPLENSEMY